MTSRYPAIRMAGLAAAVAVSFFGLSACQKVAGTGKATPDKAAAAAATALLVSSEDLITLRNNALASGPSITGSVQPERRADLRAEVSAVVVSVLKENGDPVKKGDLLVRLDDTSIRDSLMSATASEKAAVQAYRTGRAPVPAHVDSAHDRRGFGPAARGCRESSQHRPERSRRPRALAS